MARAKQHVFSARTTENGLRALSEVKARLKISWDELVLDAVCDRYGLDRAAMAPSRKGTPAEETQSGEQPPVEATAEERPTDAAQEEAPVKKRKAKGGKANKK